MKPSIIFRVPLVTLWLAVPAWAGGIDQLKRFVENTHAARANFVQVVVGKSGRKPKQSAGTMAFARPDKFFWNYEKPYKQVLIGDGQKLWAYDKDLNQVTVKKQGNAFSGTPAALLAGKGDLERDFTLSEVGRENGLDIVDAVPKAQDTTFARVRIGFADDLPRLMEVSDNFGQRTTIMFSGFERNPPLAPNTFRFTPPKGAEVLSE